MVTYTDVDTVVDKVIEDARRSAVVIGRRLSPTFLPIQSPLEVEEQRVAEEEAVDVDVKKIIDVPFEPSDEFRQTVIGVDGGQRYCGEIEDHSGIVGAVKAASTSTIKVEEGWFQIDQKHCFVLGPYLLPFLWENDKYLTAYNRLLLGLFGEYDVNPLSSISKYKLIDRTRNLLEKFAQLKTLQRIRDAIVVFDGATTLETIDTPKVIMEAILEAAIKNDNIIVGVSKNSSLRVGDQRLLDTIPPFPPGYRLKDCHMGLTEKLRNRIAGRVFAARFTKFGRVFRFDTIPPHNRESEEEHYKVARTFLSNELFSRANGYPNSVALADMESNLAGGGCERMLRARAMQDFKVTMEPRVSLMEKLRRYTSYLVHRRRF